MTRAGYLVLALVVVAALALMAYAVPGGPGEPGYGPRPPTSRTTP